MDVIKVYQRVSTAFDQVVIARATVFAYYGQINQMDVARWER